MRENLIQLKLVGFTNSFFFLILHPPKSSSLYHYTIKIPVDLVFEIASLLVPLTLKASHKV